MCCGAGILSSSVYVVFHSLVRVVAVTAKVFEPSTSRSENQMILQCVQRCLRTEAAITNVSREPERKKAAFTMVLFFFEPSASRSDETCVLTCL